MTVPRGFWRGVGFWGAKGRGRRINGVRLAGQEDGRRVCRWQLGPTDWVGLSVGE